MARIERPGKDLIAECPGGLHGHRARYGGTVCRCAAARTADRNRAGKRRLPLLQRERRGEEVLGLDTYPLERTVEQCALTRTNAGKVGALSLGRLRDDGIMAIVVQRILLGGTQSVGQVDQQYRPTTAQSRH